MPKEMDLIKLNAINRYVIDILKMRISKTAATSLVARFNELLKIILREGSQFAEKEDRNTIMPRDIDTAIEDNIGKKRLTWEDVLVEIKHLNAIGLAELSKAITKYIEDEKEKK